MSETAMRKNRPFEGGKIMKSTGIVRSMDSLGRVVIPKDVRDLLDLTAGAELEIEVLRDAIQLQPRRPPGRELAWTNDGRPYFPAVPGHETSDSSVQRLRDALQR